MCDPVCRALLPVFVHQPSTSCSFVVRATPISWSLVLWEEGQPLVVMQLLNLRLTLDSSSFMELQFRLWWLGRRKPCCISYLFLQHKLLWNLAPLNPKHALSHSFCGLGIQVWHNWVPLAQGPSQGYNQGHSQGFSYLKAQLGRDPLSNISMTTDRP